MALFGSKKNTEKKEKAEKVVAIREKSSTSVNFSGSDVILKPRITEKAGILIEDQNVYVFEVKKSASKDSIARAIKNIYKFSPLKVNIVNLPAKAVFNRGRKGVQSGTKKALVYLKKGDKIELA